MNEINEAPATPQAATPAPVAAPADDSPKTNLGEKFSKDAAWQAAMAALTSQAEAEPEAEAPAADAPPAEPVVEAAPPKELESDKWVEALKAKRRAERESARKSQALEAEKASYQTKAAELEKYAKANELIAAGDLVTAADMLGIPYEQLTAQVLRGGPKPKDPTEDIRKEIEELKAWKAEQAKSREAAERADAERGAISIVRSELADVDGIGLLKKYDGWEAEVIEYMNLEWQRTGFAGNEPPIGPKEAAIQLNAHLRNQRIQELRLAAEADPDLLRELGLTAQSQTPTPTQPNRPQATRAHGSEMFSPPRTLSGSHVGDSGRLAPTNDPKELRVRAIKAAEQAFSGEE